MAASKPHGRGWSLYMDTVPMAPRIERPLPPEKPGIRSHDLKCVLPYDMRRTPTKIERIPILGTRLLDNGALMLRTDVLDDGERNINIFVNAYRDDETGAARTYREVSDLCAAGYVVVIDQGVLRRPSRNSDYDSTYFVKMEDAEPQIRSIRDPHGKLFLMGCDGKLRDTDGNPVTIRDLLGRAAAPSPTLHRRTLEESV